MPKPPFKSDDPLVNKVRAQLKKIQPRKYPTETKKNAYGHDCWVCPYCKELIHKSWSLQRGKRHANFGQYNMHFSAMHGNKFWRETQIIKLLDKQLRIRPIVVQFCRVGFL